MLLKNRWNQLAVFLFILGVNMIFFNLFAWGTAALFWESISLANLTPAAARYINSVSAIGTFGLTALIYAFIINNRKPFSYLKMNTCIQWREVLLIVLLFGISMPALGWIIKWNEGLHLPQFFSSAEQWMRKQEDLATYLTKQMLSDTSIFALFASLFAMAVVPAICEELLFRGALLSWLKDGFKNKHLAVWLSAFIFSAIHVQFFGFFPRLLLGVYLGYLFIWTGSLWVPIIAHFLNNAVTVIAAYLFNMGYINTDYEQFGDVGEKSWIILLSALITALLVWNFWKNRRKE